MAKKATELSTEDSRVLALLAEAEQQYGVYVQLTSLATGEPFHGEADTWEHDADAPLSLTLGKPPYA